MSAWIPGSSSLIQTAAVMCIAETSAMPSAIAGLVNRGLDLVGDPDELAPLVVSKVR